MKLPFTVFALPQRLRALALLIGLATCALAPRTAAAQTNTAPLNVAPSNAAAQSAENTPAVRLTLDEAIRVALDQNYELRNVALDVTNADAQIQEAWGQLFPQVSASGSYTRNIETANPFAGSDIGGLFGGGPSGDWVAFNERARQDGDPATDPITFQAFVDRQNAGREAAGIDLAGGGGNPFGVDNEFAGGITVRQTLFNGSAFAAVKGAKQLKDVNLRAVDRQQQVTIDQVRTAYNQALLAQERAAVATDAVGRAQATVQEIDLRVERGTAPKAERLGAQVELANQRTQLVETRNQARLTKDNLKITLGVPVEQPITLAGELEAENLGEFQTVAMDDAVTLAIQQRPDLEQARLAIELNQVQQNITEAGRYPTLSAVANFNYSGRVPDNRTTSFQPDPNDPFAFEQQTSDFFSDDYWNPSFNVGLQLSWNIFSGFQRSARAEQDQVAINRAKLQYDQLRQQVRLQVQEAMQNLQAARQRIDAQEQNVQTAELNYEFTEKRVGVGATSQLELREASNQLDQSRLNYLQAVFDYVTAQSALETAVGAPLSDGSAFQFTRAE